MTSQIITFFGLSLLLAFAPGPDNLFVLMQSAMYGRKAGMCVVLGLCTGLVVHTGAVAAGLAAVFAASARAFVVLKCVGAVYLAYLAWQAFRAPVDTGPSAAADSPNPRRMYTRGIIMNITNPKVIIFFLAFLPQFVRVDKGSVGLQVMGLGLLFILATIMAFGTITCFAAAIGAMLRRSSRAQRALNWIAGAVFLGLASRLALAAR
jgi:threonine/homoserine/homoserine lactone efflux protein